MRERVFLDTSVLIRYLVEEDAPRAVAAANLIDGDRTIVISGVVLLETVHALRTAMGHSNPDIAHALIGFLSRDNVDLVDADSAAVVAALTWTIRSSARRIPDAIIAATAGQSRCDWIATFDEGFASPTVPSRLL